MRCKLWRLPRSPTLTGTTLRFSFSLPSSSLVYLETNVVQFEGGGGGSADCKGTQRQGAAAAGEFIISLGISHDDTGLTHAKVEVIVIDNDKEEEVVDQQHPVCPICLEFLRVGDEVKA